MRLRCHFCGKSVSTPVPSETLLRAALVCPECIEAGRVVVPENQENKDNNLCENCGAPSQDHLLVNFTDGPLSSGPIPLCPTARFTAKE